MAGNITLKYLDQRPIYLPGLVNHPGGVCLPNENNEIKVTDKELNGLLRMRNGKNPCWEAIKCQ